MREGKEALAHREPYDRPDSVTYDAGPRWVGDLDPSVLRAIKDLGNAAVHANDGIGRRPKRASVWREAVLQPAPRVPSSWGRPSPGRRTVALDLRRGLHLGLRSSDPLDEAPTARCGVRATSQW